MKTSLLACLLAMATLSCKKDSVVKPAVTTATVSFNFEHYVSNDSLALNTGSYLSPSGDTFSVQNFKYYVSNVKLINNSTGDVYQEKNSYHLINAKNKVSFDIKDVPANEYNQIELSIGVDMDHNHSIDQTGDLDPNNDMAWGWDTGYKFLLLEGTYQGHSSSGPLVFHIGSDSNYKTLTFPYSKILATAAKTINIYLQVNINGMFSGPNAVDFDVLNEAMGGDDAAKIAVNYSQNMFSINRVVYP